MTGSGNGDLLRMGELAEASGVPAPTIKHYLREGLLPEPVKTSRNMAYYPPEFVDRIKLIKQLQEERFMPLRAIKSVLDEDPERAGALLELEDRILDRALAGERARTSAAEVRKRYGVPREVLDRLAELEVLTPNSRGYSPSDVTIIEAIGPSQPRRTAPAGLNSEYTEYSTSTEPNTVISCIAGRWLSIQIPTYEPGMPPTMQNPGPAQNCFQDLGMSWRSCSIDSSWLAFDSVWSSGASVTGGMNSSVAAPTAENPKPDSPLISPDRNRMLSISTIWRVLKPATTSGLSGMATIRPTKTTASATDRSHNVFGELHLSTFAAPATVTMSRPPGVFGDMCVGAN